MSLPNDIANDIGRVPDGTRLSSTTAPQEGRRPTGFDPSRVADILSTQAKLSLIDAEYDKRLQALIPPFCRGTSRELAGQLLLADTGIWWKLTSCGEAVRNHLLTAHDSAAPSGDRP